MIYCIHIKNIILLYRCENSITYKEVLRNHFNVIAVGVISFYINLFGYFSKINSRE